MCVCCVSLCVCVLVSVSVFTSAAVSSCRHIYQDSMLSLYVLKLSITSALVCFQMCKWQSSQLGPAHYFTLGIERTTRFYALWAGQTLDQSGPSNETSSSSSEDAGGVSSDSGEEEPAADGEENQASTEGVYPLMSTERSGTNMTESTTDSLTTDSTTPGYGSLNITEAEAFNSSTKHLTKRSVRFSQLVQHVLSLKRQKRHRGKGFQKEGKNTDGVKKYGGRESKRDNSWIRRKRDTLRDKSRDTEAEVGSEIEQERKMNGKGYEREEQREAQGREEVDIGEEDEEEERAVAWARDDPDVVIKLLGIR